MIPHKEPVFSETAFNCPICGAYSKQFWTRAAGIMEYHGGGWSIEKYPENAFFATCEHCNKESIWINERMIYPLASIAPIPNQDMPDDVKIDYEEARSILMHSPRGAAALLRLSIQKLCKNLGESGDNINNDIANLVKKGLPIKLQKALDSVRVIGNNAVHPGIIDLKDDIELAHKLFSFVNIICDVMITQPKLIDEVYDSKIPDNLKEAINKRDKK